jgi:hypothetical protein
MFGLVDVDKKTCIENLESFTREEIIPKRE